MTVAKATFNSFAEAAALASGLATAWIALATTAGVLFGAWSFFEPKALLSGLGGCVTLALMSLALIRHQSHHSQSEISET